MKRFLKTAALLALAWVHAAPAFAAVVITALPTPEALRDELIGSYHPVDIDGNGTVDFTFRYNPSEVSFRTERENRLIYIPDSPPNIGGGVASLQEPFLIEPTLGAPDLLWGSSDPLGGYVEPGEIAFSQIVVVLNTGTASHFNGRGAIGAEFESDLGTHYGYIDIDAGPGYAGLTLYGWVYETQPGVGIMAGQVPEPSAAVLAGLGIGAMFLRRRRDRVRKIGDRIMMHHLLSADWLSEAYREYAEKGLPAAKWGENPPTGHPQHRD